MTTQTSSRRIHPGARVECTDRPLGEVIRLESTESGAPTSMRVQSSESQAELLVPLDLVKSVSADGTVHLRCGIGQLDRLEQLDESSPMTRTVRLEEEELIAHKELRERGRIHVRKEVDVVPRRLEVDAYSEEAIIEHVPVGKVVKEQVPAWEEDGVMIVPVYEEQVVLVKRLVMKEQIRIRRESSTEKQVFEETVRRERLVVDDPDNTGRVREHYPTEDELDRDDDRSDEDDRHEPDLLERLGRKVLE